MWAPHDGLYAAKEEIYDKIAGLTKCCLFFAATFEPSLMARW